MAMIWIAPGTFLMSSTHGAGDDTLVTLTRGYWLGQTEVTQGQWQAVIDRVPVPSFFKGSDRPVEQVGWNLVMEFCLKLTERERAAGRLPEGYTYTLPTEAQWEYACRAGTTGKYAGEIEAMAWYDTNSGAQTHPVAL
jgi:formylglycine-generating enzyme required for sulfatase activity